MADFKDELSPTLVARLAGDIADVSASFGQAAFVQLAETGLSNLELKARIDWIARALSATMPPSPEDADQVIRAALANGGLEGWASMPVNAYVASAMINSPDIALPLLAILTPRYTAEFAIRPFIDPADNVHAIAGSPDVAGFVGSETDCTVAATADVSAGSLTQPHSSSHAPSGR